MKTVWLTTNKWIGFRSLWLLSWYNYTKHGDRNYRSKTPPLLVAIWYSVP